MKTATAVLAATAVILIASAVTPAQAPAGYEPEPVLNAKDLASAELLKGPHFSVDPKVPVKGFISGRLTPLAQKELTKRGWTLFESFTTAAAQ